MRFIWDEGMGLARGRVPGPDRTARGLRRVAVIVVVALGALMTIGSSSALAAPPPGTLLPAGGVKMISVVVPVRANATYRSLLPGPINAPTKPTGPGDSNRPAVQLIGLNLTIPSSFGPYPAGYTTFQNYTMLRSSYCDQSGWYNRADGTVMQFVYDIGHALGISKYMLDLDETDLEPDTNPGLESAVRPIGDGRWRSTALLDGKPLVKLTWRKDPEALARLLDEQPWQRHLLKGSGQAYDGPIWDTFPLTNEFTGMINWLDAYVPDVDDPPAWKNHVGVVRIKVRQDADPARTEGDWMSLVPKTVQVPGVFQKFSKGISYVTADPRDAGAC